MAFVFEIEAVSLQGCLEPVSILAKFMEKDFGQSRRVPGKNRTRRKKCLFALVKQIVGENSLVQVSSKKPRFSRV